MFRLGRSRVPASARCYHTVTVTRYASMRTTMGVSPRCEPNHQLELALSVLIAIFLFLQAGCWRGAGCPCPPQNPQRSLDRVLGRSKGCI